MKFISGTLKDDFSATAQRFEMWFSVYERNSLGLSYSLNVMDHDLYINRCGVCFLMQGTLEEWGKFPLLFGFSENDSLCRPGPIVVAEIILLKSLNCKTDWLFVTRIDAYRAGFNHNS